MRKIIALITIIVGILAVPAFASAEANWYPVGMEPCPSEDSPGPCYYDGLTMGNNIGPRYWIDENQNVHFHKPQVCTGDTIEVKGKVTEITFDAPEGFLIRGYCVKAGSVNQDLGPEYQAFMDGEEPETVTFSHSSGKEISQYSITLVPKPTPTTTTVPPTTTIPEPPTTIEQPTTTISEVEIPTTTTIPTPVVSTTPDSTPATTTPDSTVAMTTLPHTGNEPWYILGGSILIALGATCLWMQRRFA